MHNDHDRVNDHASDLCHRFSRRQLGRIALLAALLCPTLGACALTTDTLVPTYQPQQWARRVNGAEQVTVRVMVRDMRRDRARVSVKKNGYGMEMAPIVSATDVPAFVRANVAFELARRGFTVAEGTGLVIDVELRKYFNDFKIGFMSGDAVAEVTFDVTAYQVGPDGEGPPIYLGHFEGTGENNGIQLCSGENAKVALDAAFVDAMRLMFSDRRFFAALMQTAPPPPYAPPTPPPPGGPSAMPNVVPVPKGAPSAAPTS
jgi:uncharacterized lipoprotein